MQLLFFVPCFNAAPSGPLSWVWHCFAVGFAAASGARGSGMAEGCGMLCSSKHCAPSIPLWHALRRDAQFAQQQQQQQQ